MTLKLLDRSRPEPLYHQLEVLLRERILSGEWGAGEQIPTEEQLVEVYGVSRVTVRQAIQNLVRDGHLVRGQGRGTFVRKPTLTAGERGLVSFSQDMQALGLTPGSQILEAQVVPASTSIAGRLELAAGDPVHRIRRLRTGDGQPIGLQTSYLSAQRFPGLVEQLDRQNSLYEALASNYGLTLFEAHETFTVTSIPEETAATLGVTPGACAFHVERLARDERRPFEFTVSVMRGDRYRISWTLRHSQGEER